MWACADKMIIAFPKLKTSAKSVQTSAEVCADYTCSLYRLQLKSPESTTYLQFYVRVLTKVFTRKYNCKCAYLLFDCLPMGCRSLGSSGLVITHYLAAIWHACHSD